MADRAFAPRPPAGEGALKTPVVLAALAPADGADFVAAARASRALHGAWVSPPLSAEAFAAFQRRHVGPADFGFTLRRRDGGALVGFVQITNIVRGVFRSAYVGYYGFAGHQRQGLMTAGLKLAARHAFGALALHRLEANIQPANAASIALVRACGFEREGYSRRYLKIGGRWRDHERWALLSD
jgi:[ribosomal protein S5]-alanine N-acetyltransferase